MLYKAAVPQCKWGKIEDSHVDVWAAGQGWQALTWGALGEGAACACVIA